MRKSKGSVVVGGEGAGDWLAGQVVVPDGGGQGEEPLEDSNQDALRAVASVAFQAELGLQCGVDGLDDLAQGFELASATAGTLVTAGRADQLDAALGELGFEGRSRRINTWSWSADFRSRLL
jgi:hypothetical protein